MTGANGRDDGIRTGGCVATSEITGIGCSGFVSFADFKTIPLIDAHAFLGIQEAHIRHLADSGDNGIDL